VYDTKVQSLLFAPTSSSLSAYTYPYSSSAPYISLLHNPYTSRRVLRRQRHTSSYTYSSWSSVLFRAFLFFTIRRVHRVYKYPSSAHYHTVFSFVTCCVPKDYSHTHTHTHIHTHTHTSPCVPTRNNPLPTRNNPRHIVFVSTPLQCTKCGATGHMAKMCMAGGTSYALIDEPEDEGGGPATKSAIDLEFEKHQRRLEKKAQKVRALSRRGWDSGW
jgi:hypothetical protein